MFRRLVTVAAVSAPVCIRSVQLRTAYAETSSPPKVATAKIIIQDDNEAEDDAEWLLEKEKCSFCKSFLHSPCKIQFRHWMKCIDKSKELEVDMVEACTDYSTLLFACTADNQEYFMSLAPADDDIDEEEENGLDKTAVVSETVDNEVVLTETVVLDQLSDTQPVLVNTLIVEESVLVASIPTEKTDTSAEVESS